MAQIPPKYFLSLSQEKQIEHAIKEKQKHECLADEWKKILQRVYAGQVAHSAGNSEDDELYFINLK